MMQLTNKRLGFSFLIVLAFGLNIYAKHASAALYQVSNTNSSDVIYGDFKYDYSTQLFSDVSLNLNPVTRGVIAFNTLERGLINSVTEQFSESSALTEFGANVAIENSSIDSLSVGITSLSGSFYEFSFDALSGQFLDQTTPFTGINFAVTDITPPPVSPVPEPETYAMFAVGLVVLGQRKFKQI